MPRRLLCLSMATFMLGGAYGQTRSSPGEPGEPSSEPSALAAEGEARLALTTNAAYLLLSAVSLRPKSVFLILPLELQIALGPRLALAPAALLIYNGGSQATLLLECGLAWRPRGGRLAGWYASAVPGVAYAVDSSAWCLVLSGSVGYQWVLPSGPLLGLGGGWRYLATSGGSMSIPDLEATVGWAWR